MQKIMFNAKLGLEQAVLKGSKTMTRRLATTKKPQYTIGEVVAIAQSYKSAGYEPGRNIPIQAHRGLQARADSFAGWENKMFVRADHMPHRIRITDVKMEQLRCISDEECLREGIYARADVIDTQMRNVIRYQYPNTAMMFKSPRDAFASLIDKVSGKGTWESNPFVYAYSFELIC